MNRRTLALTGILALLVAAPGAMAAQTKAAESADAEDILHKIRRKRYVLSGNFERKRDMFTFRKPRPKAPTPPPPPPWDPEVTDGRNDGSRGTPKKPEPPAKKEFDYEGEVRLSLKNATSFLAGDAFSEAADSAKVGLDSLVRSGDKIEETVRFELHEKLDRIRIAAERQIRRLATEKRFKDLALTVKGILISESGPRAVINAEVFGEGDFIRGALIRRIESDHVEFEYEGLRIRRSLPKPQAKRG